jgi:phage gpG-like protein
VGRAILALATRLTADVKAGKLSGNPLAVRTGALRRSINMRPQGIGTDTPLATVGTNMVYAAAHEFGFSGTVNVRAHMRTVKKAWGRSISPRAVQIGPMSRNMRLPARSFLRSALRELEPVIESTMRAEINRRQP